MELIYKAGLMFSLFYLNYQLFVPTDMGTSPYAVSTDRIKRKIEGFYTGGDGQHQLNITNKNTNDLMKITIAVGTFLSLLLILLTFRSIGKLSLLLVLPAFIISALYTRNAIALEFKAWQSQMCDGLSTLLEFMKSFFKLDGITTNEALKQSVEHIPEPLKTELSRTVQYIEDKGDPKTAFDNLADKVKHRLFYAVSFRLGVGWDNKITPNICDDLLKQIEHDKDTDAAKTTAKKSGSFALICALGIAIAAPIYGYPIAKAMGLTFFNGVFK